MGAKNNHILIFSRQERTGIFLLLFIIFAIAILPGLLITDPVVEKTSEDLSKKLALLKADKKEVNDNGRNVQYENQFESYTPAVKFTLFKFDPNTIEDEGWIKLGVNEKTIRSIRNFLSKGGRFRKPEDISKVWGIRKEHADKLMQFVNIIPEHRENNYQEQRTFTKYERPSPQIIDVNAADSIAFASLPGIGPKLSSRIINYRKRLGGFVSAEQVAETFGLHDSTFQKIKPYLVVDGNGINRISINSATLEDLRSHPYIRYHLANAIIQYRLQHGNFKDVKDLRHIMLMNDSIIKRIAPYLDVGD